MAADDEKVEAGERRATEIREALSSADTDLPDTLQGDAFAAGSPSAVSRGAEGVTTFAGYSATGDSAEASRWVDDQLRAGLRDDKAAEGDAHPLASDDSRPNGEPAG